MKNRVCLITGGTSGVGKATALGLAKQGATVVLLTQSEDRGMRVAEEISRSSGNRNILPRVADLANLKSIHSFASDFINEFKYLHVLSNNAAVLPMQKELTSEGIEKIFAVNYLSHFVLTYLLLDLLQSSAPARVITVSGTPSILQKGTIDLNDINLDNNYSPFKATYRAAVAKVMFSYELAKRLQDTGVTSNTFHPGLVKSNLSRNLPAVLKLIFKIAQIAFTTDCKTSIYLASSPKVETISGQFFKSRKVVKFTPKHNFSEVAAQLWQKSLELAQLS